MVYYLSESCCFGEVVFILIISLLRIEIYVFEHLNGKCQLNSNYLKLYIMSLNKSESVKG